MTFAAKAASALAIAHPRPGSSAPALNSIAASRRPPLAILVRHEQFRQRGVRCWLAYPISLHFIHRIHRQSARWLTQMVMVTAPGQDVLHMPMLSAYSVDHEGRGAVQSSAYGHLFGRMLSWHLPAACLFVIDILLLTGALPSRYIASPARFGLGVSDETISASPCGCNFKMTLSSIAHRPECRSSHFMGQVLCGQ